MAYRQLPEERQGTSPASSSGPTSPTSPPQKAAAAPRPASPLRHEVRYDSSGASSQSASLIDFGTTESNPPTYYSTAGPPSNPTPVQPLSSSMPSQTTNSPPKRIQSPVLSGKIGQSTTNNKAPTVNLAANTINPPATGQIASQMDTLDEPVWHTIVPLFYAHETEGGGRH